MKLNDLKPNKGAKKNRKRVGHGISAGQGKTAGRGTKGQRARSGEGGRLYRQGGNLPFFRKLPFIRGEGFTPPAQVFYNEINLSQLAKLPANTEVNPEFLQKKGWLKKVSNPIAILGDGELQNPLNIKVHRITKSAKAKIEKAGGKIELINRLESK